MIIQSNNAYSYRRCPYGRLVFAGRSATVEELNVFYNDFLLRDPDTSKISSPPRYYSMMTRRVLVDAISDFIKSIRAALEFGVGIGFFADVVRDPVDRVTLHEVDLQAASYLLSMFPGSVRGSQQRGSRVNRPRWNLLRHDCNHRDPLNNKTLDHRCPARYLLGLRAVGYFSGRFQVSRRLETDSWWCYDPPRHLHAVSNQSITKDHFELLGRTTQYTNQKY